ncbi:MAG: TIGR02391 family protein [Actinobacteria bacterium]|nr:TIGR02391 family protein [Actinomycetota bacterium]
MSMTMRGPVDPYALRTLPTSECAVLLLRSIVNSRTVNSHNTFRGAEQAFQHNGERDVNLLLERLSDAWAWLEAHALIGPDPNQSGGWQRVTTRGRTLANDAQAVAVVLAEDRLAMDLHPLLESKIRPYFMLGDYETASFSAMKAVEVRVRRLADASNSLLGTKLMQEAFKPDGGRLADAEADGGEQVAMMQLFAGAIGTFKNPPSHRTVAYDDPTEAAEVILLADLLLRLLDRVEQRTSGPA